MKLSHEEKLSLLQGLINYVTPELLWESDINLSLNELSACIFDAARTQIEDVVHLYEDVALKDPNDLREKFGAPVDKIRFYSFQVGKSIVSMVAKPADQKIYMEAKENPGDIRSIRSRVNEDGILHFSSKRDDIFWTFGLALEFVENWMVNRNLENNTPEAKKIKRGHRL